MCFVSAHVGCLCVLFVCVSFVFCVVRVCVFVFVDLSYLLVFVEFCGVFYLCVCLCVVLLVSLACVSKMYLL